jgi:hypothetical protein
MGTVAILIIGVVLGLAIFLVLFIKGHLNGFLNHNVQTSDITDSVVNIRVNNKPIVSIPQEETLYDEYCKMISGLKFSRDFDTEKKKLRIELENKVNEIRSVRDKSKIDADNLKTYTIQSSEKEYENNQRIRNLAKSQAETLWQSQTNERDREKAKARNEYDKRVQEIERLHESRRSELYKAKNEADNVYAKAQDLHSRNKTLAYNKCSNDKSKVDVDFNNSKTIIDSTYSTMFKKLHEELKKEINEQLTPEQKEKYKKYL